MHRRTYTHPPTHSLTHSHTHLNTNQQQQSKSDFPYVTTLGGGYVEAPRAVLEWRKAGLLPSLTEKDYENLFSLTFVRVFGEE